MNKEPLLYGIIGLLAGTLFGVLIATTAVNTGNSGMMRMMGMRTPVQSETMDMMDMDHGSSSTHTGASMDDMTAALSGKSGDDFDKAFIADMIDHHQGAIDMATLAKQNAKHNEIKKMADDIISAQTKEITQLKSWRNSWG